MKVLFAQHQLITGSWEHVGGSIRFGLNSVPLWEKRDCYAAQRTSGCIIGSDGATITQLVERPIESQAQY